MDTMIYNKKKKAGSPQQLYQNSISTIKIGNMQPKSIYIISWLYSSCLLSFCTLNLELVSS